VAANTLASIKCQAKEAWIKDGGFIALIVNLYCTAKQKTLATMHQNANTYVLSMIKV
jgi:hypothetical protein